MSGSDLVNHSDNQKKQEMQDNLDMLAYLMYTPLNRLPAMPNTIENEDNTKLGVDILNLIQENKISIHGMDKNGLLIIS